METYKGHQYTGPIHTLDQLRAAVAQVADLPGTTRIYRTEDDANQDDSYTLVNELEIAYWDGEVQCEADDEGAVKALFL